MNIDDPPRVLSRFTAGRKNKSYKIRIEIVTRNLLEPVVDHMSAYFLAREPITSNCNISSDPVSLHEMQMLWRETIKQGASLVAILEDEDSGMPGNIVGANVTGISCKDKKESAKIEGELFTKVLDAIIFITNKGNLFEKYDVDKYLTAYGLSVHPEYHGLGIGLKLLEAREPLCKAIGIRMSATVFTAATSQYLASKAGFELITEYYYKNYNVGGQILFPDLDEKIALMARTYM